MIEVFPSLLSADFGSLSEEVKRMEEAGADGIHVDIMDGHFVPNLTLGPKALAAVRRSTSLFLDVHLMIYNPYDFIELFVEAGADQITIHFEATESIEETLSFIQTCGKRGSLAFSPETSLSMIQRFIPLCSQILIMTVSPGFGGQPFIPTMLNKVKQCRKWAQEMGHPIKIQVDGGINSQTAPKAVQAGADVLVSGEFLFHSQSLKEGIDILKHGLK